MTRLPTPGSDDGTWGNILNDFLAQAHNVDGSLKDDTVADAQLSAGTGSDGQALVKDSSQTGGMKWMTLSGSASPATSGSLGTIQLAQDLGGTATAPTVPGLASKADKTTSVTAGAGLTGGGDLSASRTLAANFGTTGGTIAEGNDSRLTAASTAVQSVNGHTGTSVSVTAGDIGLSNVDNTSDTNKPVSTATQTALNAKADKTTALSAGTGLTGGGDLSTNRTISANFGTTAGTIAQGNDSRITGAEQTANKNQTNGYAGLDGSTKVAFSQLPTGTTGSTVAVGNHTHTLTFSLTSFYKSGALSIATGTQLLPVDGTYTIVGTRLTAGTAPAGAAIIVDVNKNGTTIYTTQANRPTIAAGTQTGGPGSAPDVTALSAGDYLSVDIDQVGSGTAGSDLTVSVIVSKIVQ